MNWHTGSKALTWKTVTAIGVVGVVLVAAVIGAESLLPNQTDSISAGETLSQDFLSVDDPAQVATESDSDPKEVLNDWSYTFRRNFSRRH